MKNKPSKKIKNETLTTVHKENAGIKTLSASDLKPQFLQPLNKPRIAAINYNVRLPTSSGRLYVANELNRSGQTKAKTISCSWFQIARNPFEKAAAHFFDRFPPKPLATCKDPAKAEFMFRYFYCPIFASSLIGWFKKQNAEVPPLWLAEPASYLIALERTHLEMVLSLTEKPDNTFNESTWGKPITQADMEKLPKPTADWFFNPPGRLEFWKSRFEAWKKSSSISFRRWVSTWCRDVDGLPLIPAKAAFLGALVHKSLLPPGIMDNLMQKLKESHNEALKAFFKNVAAPESLHHGDTELDCWLIEIWPLASTRKWNYPKISELAKRRFDLDEKGAALDQSGIQARCEKLQLILHKSLHKGGRPSKMPNQTQRDPFELMAIWIQSIGMKKDAWLAGQRALWEQ